LKSTQLWLLRSAMGHAPGCALQLVSTAVGHSVAWSKFRASHRSSRSVAPSGATAGGSAGGATAAGGWVYSSNVRSPTTATVTLALSGVAEPSNAT
jgi:hypothetical protein